LVLVRPFEAFVLWGPGPFVAAGAQPALEALGGLPSRIDTAEPSGLDVMRIAIPEDARRSAR